VSVESFIDIKSFRSHYDPGVDSASNINEYQEYFFGVKGGRCVRLTTLPPSCTFVTKFGNLNFLEPSGPVQASNGTAFTFFCTRQICCGVTEDNTVFDRDAATDIYEDPSQKGGRQTPSFMAP